MTTDHQSQLATKDARIVELEAQRDRIDLWWHETQTKLHEATNQLTKCQGEVAAEREYSESLAKDICKMEDVLGFKNDCHDKEGAFVPTIGPWLERVRDLLASEGELGDTKEEVTRLTSLLAKRDEVLVVALEALEGYPCYCPDDTVKCKRCQAIALIHSLKGGDVKCQTTSIESSAGKERGCDRSEQRTPNGWHANHQSIFGITCGGGDPSVGCGEPIEYLSHLFKCADCETPFHKHCIKKHFSASTLHKLKEGGKV